MTSTDSADSNGTSGTDQPRGELAIRTLAMPADTNPSGDIFGGWLMSQMDLAAGTVAACTSGGRSATVAVDGMIFHRPVKVGDEVSLYARLTKLGKSSMKIHVDAWRRPREARLSERSRRRISSSSLSTPMANPLPCRACETRYRSKAGSARLGEGLEH